MQKYRCISCGLIYDPQQGHPDSGVKAGLTSIDNPDDWVCPVCSARKENFSPMEEMHSSVVGSSDTEKRQSSNATIIEEQRNINQQITDSKYNVYKKSTYWHQQISGQPDINMKDMLMQVTEQLKKIEVKLESIENKLKL